MASIHVNEPIADDDSIDSSAEQIQSNQETPVYSTEQTSFSPRSNNKISSLLANPNARTLLIVIIIILLFIGYTAKNNKDKQKLEQQVASLQQPEQKQAVDDEAMKLKEEVGQFLELPADETPTVATVVDAEKVKGQAFFKNAQNGDKVLLFATSGKAILYRPTTKKIIEVAPINLGQTEGNAAPESTQESNNTTNQR